MDQKLLRYLIVAFISSILFNLIPQNNNPIKEMWLFVTFCILLFYLLDSNGLVPIQKENFDNNIEILNVSSHSAGFRKKFASINLNKSEQNNDTNKDVSNNDTNKNDTNENKVESNKNTNQPKILPANNPTNIKVLPKLDLISQPTLTELEYIENKINSLRNEDKSRLLSQLNINYKPSDDCNCENKIQEVIEKYLGKGKVIDERGIINNLLEGDMKYNQLDPSQMQPLGSYDKTFTNKWDHGFTYLNTDRWAPPIYKPPVCKTEKNCPISPMNTTGYPLDLMEFNNSLKIMGPDEINVKYITEKLNK